METCKLNEDDELYEFFGHRYAYLLNLHKKVVETSWRIVLRELKRTLEDYDMNSKELVVDCIKNRKPISPTCKRSMNCVAVCCALFCEKFRDLEIEVDISYIIGRIHENITSMLPCISHSLVAVRMVEVMLYTMFPISYDYKDDDGHWSMLGATCFRHPGASPEMKIASSIIVCELDVEKKYVDVNMYQYLQDVLLNESYFGFKEKHVKCGLHLIQDRFQKGIKIKDLVTEPRDSGFKTDSEIESEGSYSKDHTRKQGQNRRVKTTKKQKNDANDESPKEISWQNNIMELSIASAFGGIMVTLVAIWLLRKNSAK